MDAYKQKTLKEINSIPPDKVTEPNLQVTGQAIENSKFCIESDELTTMFSKLIAASMNSDTLSNVHPSFPEIIKQMSPQDAHLLLDFKKFSILPICNYKVSQKDLSFKTPLTDIYLNNLYLDTEPTYYSNSLSSLSRLGLINIDFVNFLKDEFYAIYTNHPYYTYLQTTYGSDRTSIQKGLAELTPLGKSFIKVCVPDKFD